GAIGAGSARSPWGPGRRARGIGAPDRTRGQPKLIPDRGRPRRARNRPGRKQPPPGPGGGRRRRRWPRDRRGGAVAAGAGARPLAITAAARDRGLPPVTVASGYMRVGAIDVGTNSIRLLVADIRSGAGPRELLTVSRAGEPCRLGRGLGRSGEVDQEMADRAATLAAEFARRARSLGARHIVLGATAALREAANRVSVVGLIEQRSGVRVRILSGQDEARL